MDSGQAEELMTTIEGAISALADTHRRSDFTSSDMLNCAQAAHELAITAQIIKATRKSPVNGR